MNGSEPSAGLRAFVAATPMLGAVAFPLVVPLLILKVNIQAGVLAAVLIGCLWFVAMLRTAEMPGHS
ncbi:MAG: hypothetical protein VKO00_07680 [Cyanobacteriota bacterium]|jgi:hypothetical protein|nr:hypothetical protein [Cyanobacteriota bacterium]